VNTSTPDGLPKMINQKELCQWLKISPMTAYNWRLRGAPFIGWNGKVWYDPEQIILWMKAHTRKMGP
jgi:hypothetical protein